MTHPYMCDMNHPYVWHDSFICVTWLIHTCDMTQSYVWHDSHHNVSASHCNTLQRTAPHCNTLHHTATQCTTLHHTAPHCTTLQHAATRCNTLQHDWHHDHNRNRKRQKKWSICIRHDSLLPVTWRICTWDGTPMTYLHVWRDSHYDSCHEHNHDSCHEHNDVIRIMYLYLWHDVSISVTPPTWRIHTCDVTWLIHICDTVYLYVWHDSSTRVTLLIYIRVTWLIHTCDIIYLCARHDSSTLTTWLVSRTQSKL